MRHSIFLKITFFFLITFIGMGTGFYALHQELTKEHTDRLQVEADTMLIVLRRSILLPPATRETLLLHHGYRLIHSDALAARLKPALLEIPKNYPQEIKASLKEGRIQILKDDRHLYIYLAKASPPFLLMKPDIAQKPLWPEILLLILMIALLLFYLLILKTVFPLKTLIRTIERYGKGEEYLPIKSLEKNEIAMISNALDTAMQKNRLLMEARHLFMRNIMHELKTPITAGKLALPFLKPGEERSILERAFIRMEHLIKEVVRVEQITSGTLAPDLKECDPKQLIEKAANLLFIPSEALRVACDGTLIHADCDVFVTVFKNLIDNALKYSPDHTVSINQTRSRIVFSNRGEAWPEGSDLESLSEPFFHHNSNPDSFGLGLYLVTSIVHAHGFKITYRYESGEHRFELECRNSLFPND